MTSSERPRSLPRRRQLWLCRRATLHARAIILNGSIGAGAMPCRSRVAMGDVGEIQVLPAKAARYLVFRIEVDAQQTSLNIPSSISLPRHGPPSADHRAIFAAATWSRSAPCDRKSPVTGERRHGLSGDRPVRIFSPILSRWIACVPSECRKTVASRTSFSGPAPSR